MTHECRWTDERTNREWVCRLEVTPFSPGTYNGPPEDCYPDEGGEAELISMKCGEVQLIYGQACVVFGTDIIKMIEEKAAEECRDEDWYLGSDPGDETGYERDWDY